jgi:putative phosphoesterase
MSQKFKYCDNYLVGIIADTHGHLGQSVQKAFENTDLIIHAGDIGQKDVLNELEKIAPTIAVRGNMDSGEWADPLPQTEIIEIGKIFIYVLHDLHRLDFEPHTAGFKAVIAGHTHQPGAYKNNGILFLNPGSASYPKFGYRASVALLNLKENYLTTYFINLKD